MGDTRELIEYALCLTPDGWWVAIIYKERGMRRNELGPYDTREEADTARTDLVQTMRELGAIDVPGRQQ